MMYRTVLLGLVALALVACGHVPPKAPVDPEVAQGTGYLEGGPTVKIDTTPANRTTLELLDQKILEAAKLKQELEAARRSEAEATSRTAAAEMVQADLATRLSELEKLLASQGEENKNLMDELLKARIARLRIERQMIQGRIADLVDEKK